MWRSRPPARSEPPGSEPVRNRVRRRCPGNRRSGCRSAGACPPGGCRPSPDAAGNRRTADPAPRTSDSSARSAPPSNGRPDRTGHRNSSSRSTVRTRPAVFLEAPGGTGPDGSRSRRCPAASRSRKYKARRERRPGRFRRNPPRPADGSPPGSRAAGTPLRPAGRPPHRGSPPDGPNRSTPRAFFRAPSDGRAGQVPPPAAAPRRSAPRGSGRPRSRPAGSRAARESAPPDCVPAPGTRSHRSAARCGGPGRRPRSTGRNRPTTRHNRRPARPEERLRQSGEVSCSALFAWD